MTILLVKTSDDCPACGATVRVYRDLPSGRVILRDLGGEWNGDTHLCQGGEAGPEQIERVTVCDKCTAVTKSDSEIIGSVALTSWGRVIENYFPFPARPYEAHVCVPAAQMRALLDQPIRIPRPPEPPVPPTDPKPITVWPAE